MRRPPGTPFRFAIKARDSGHAVRAFLLGPGVECEGIRQDAYDVPAQRQAFADRGGERLACGTCLRTRQMEGPDRFDNAGTRRPDYLGGPRLDVLSRLREEGTGHAVILGCGHQAPCRRPHEAAR